MYHGEYYSGSRLHRFGLKDNPFCERCQELDTINHRLVECQPIKNLWDALTESTNRLDILRNLNHDTIRNAIGAISKSSTALLTINCELLTNVMRKDFLATRNPHNFISNLIKSVLRKENNEKVKRDLISLLGDATND